MDISIYLKRKDIRLGFKTGQFYKVLCQICYVSVNRK